MSSRRRPATTATAFTSSGSGCAGAGGFTLVELAVAIFIITLLLGSMLVPLQTQVESRKQEETVRILEQARDALLGYAATYGYLPCPADYALGSAGAEAAGSSHVSGACAATVTGGGTAGVYIGYFPAVTLGFTPTDANGYAVDGWGTALNRIRYAVSASTVNTVTNPFTRTSGMRSAGMSSVVSATLLSICTTATGTGPSACASAATTLASNAVAVIWSLGPNAGTSGGTSANEAENAEVLASADRVFIKRDYSNVTGAEFDDIVTWISPPTLFHRMLAAGQLP